MQSSPALTSLIALLAAAPIRTPASAPRPGAAAFPEAGLSDDSVRTVRAARRAQEQFEALRRANLPFRPGPGRGPCDLQVGRMCYWHDDGAPQAPVPEPARITRGRDRLLTVLEDASRRVRGDEWIAGQRVRYLIEAGRTREAVAAAGACEATTWWCAALGGLALHRAEDYAGADSAFAAALAAMPAERRCEWSDISLFLEGDVAKRYGRLPCSDRATIERRFWWLSQPLYALPGNDLRTEFFARRTMGRLEQQARSAYNLSWGRDVEELLMRFGWPTWWTRDYPSGVIASPGPPAIVGHEPTPSFYFHAALRLIEGSPADAHADDWQPRAPRPPARYAPAYAAGFTDLRAQVAMFRRVDTTVVVAAYEHPDDSLFDDVVPEASLAVARDELSPVTVVGSGADRGAPLVAKTTWRPMLVSVELRAPRKRGVARSRFGAGPRAPSNTTAALSLSDLLLFRGGDSVGAVLEDVARHALGSARVTVGGRVGVYWELYGVRPAGESLSVTLTVERVGVGWTTRAAERLGLAAKVTPLRVRWHEVPKGDAGFAPRAIQVDLSTLPPGRYRMQLTVAAEGGGAAQAERAIELTPAR